MESVGAVQPKRNPDLEMVLERMRSLQRVANELLSITHQSHNYIYGTTETTVSKDDGKESSSYSWLCECDTICSNIENTIHLTSSFLKDLIPID